MNKNIVKKINIKNLIIAKLSCLMFAFLILFSFSVNVCYSQNSLQETKQKIKKLKQLERREMNKLNRNQQKLENAEKELINSKNRYDVTKNKLVDIQTQYEIALRDFNKVDYGVSNRIRQMYKKNHANGLIEMLLAADDINDLFDKIYFQNIIAKNDKENFEKVRSKARKIAKIKYDMETQKFNLERSIRTIDSQQKSIQKAINENEKYIEKLKNDRATYEKAERELAKNSSNLESMISKSAKKEETLSTSGTFLRPISGPITSPYGYRIHPIFKSRNFHSGIDIGGPRNGSVKAANSGKVIYVGWYGGYGKVVIIDHGKYNGSPTTTLYAHLNSFSVSVGQYVVRGQVLGKEGATGYATGPHLHFEVRVNGKPRNPQNYI